ncbi:hypothetical protein [Nostoc sp. CALU 1950]
MKAMPTVDKVRSLSFKQGIATNLMHYTTQRFWQCYDAVNLKSVNKQI